MAIDYINGGCIKVTTVKTINFLNNHEQVLATPISACIIDEIRKNDPQSCFSHSLQLQFIMPTNLCKTFDELKGINITLTNDTIIQLGWGAVSSQHSATLEEQHIGSYHIYTLRAGGYIKLQTSEKTISLEEKQLGYFNNQVYTISLDNNQEHELQCVLSHINYNGTLASMNPDDISYSIHDDHFNESPSSLTYPSLSERSPRLDRELPQRSHSDPTFLNSGNQKSSAYYSGEIASLADLKIEVPATFGTIAPPPMEITNPEPTEINQRNFIESHLSDNGRPYKTAINETILDIISTTNFSETQYGDLLSTHKDFAIPVLGCYLSAIPLDYRITVTRLCALILFNTRRADKINHSWTYAFSRNDALVYQARATLLTHLLLIYAVNNDLYSLWGGYAEKLTDLKVILTGEHTYLAGNWQEVLRQLLIQHDIVDSENTNLKNNPSWQALALYVVPELKYYYLKAHIAYLTTFFATSETTASQQLKSLLSEQVFTTVSSTMSVLFNTFKIVAPIPLLGRPLAKIGMSKTEQNTIVNLLFWISYYKLQYEVDSSETARHHLLSAQLDLINLAIHYNFVMNDILYTSMTFNRIPEGNRFYVLELLLAVEDAKRNGIDTASSILALKTYIEPFRPQSPRAMASPTGEEGVQQVHHETTLIPTTHQEKIVMWVADSEVTHCYTQGCGKSFGYITRKHHCRGCGHIFCDSCSNKKGWVPANTIFIKGTDSESTTSGSWERMCDPCHKTNTQQPETVRALYKMKNALAF